MLYMIEAKSTGDYSFVTKRLGYFSHKAGVKKAMAMNRLMIIYLSKTRFYLTPILDI